MDAVYNEHVTEYIIFIVKEITFEKQKVKGLIVFGKQIQVLEVHFAKPDMLIIY